jgi:hypothetical protein
MHMRSYRYYAADYRGYGTKEKRRHNRDASLFFIV